MRNVQIYEEASDWLVEFRTSEVEAIRRREFDGWLRTSPEHMRAYLEIAAIWNEGSAIDPQRAIDIDALISRATLQTPVVPLATRPKAVAPPRRVPRTAMLASAAVLALSIVAGLAGWRLWQADTFGTRTGEQRSLKLSDGSTVELNSQSRLRVTYSRRERRVELLDGQALFQVARERARPFIVESGATRVRAVGTQFDVYRRRAGTTVTVLEGRVVVNDKAHVTVLSAGEQAVAGTAAVAKPHRANVLATTAWTQRRIVFDSVSLAEAAQEFNRYNAQQLVIEDPQGLTGLHISGVFSSTDPASLVRFLEARFGVEARQTDSEIRLSKK
jgi:transmembrane sensor